MCDTGSDKTSIDVDQAKAQNSRLRQLGSDFSGSVSRLRSAAQRYDGSWGGDKFGAAFAKGYVPNASETLKNVTTFGQNVGATADQVDQAIAEFEKTDQGNAKNL
jgi:uncharacterized protein YukE